MSKRLRVAGAIAVALALAAVTAGSVARAGGGLSGAKKGDNCTLHGHGTGIKHVIYLQFDNTHLFRDRSNVASDLEQMPHLLNFLTDNGTLSDNEHTILISHTAGGILSSLTGLYPDRMGQGVSNSYGFFRSQNQSVGFSSSFKYWTDITDGGNPATDPPGAMTKVFGEGSPEWNEGRDSQIAPFATAARARALTDFVGIAIHCAASHSICSGDSNARDDQLPDEPGGYTGYKGLFGAKYVNPAINDGSNVVDDTNG